MSLPTSIVPDAQSQSHPEMGVADGEFELLEKTNV